MKQYTVYDATKEELIEFCFNPFEVRGVLMKERFLEWLQKKRADELMDAHSKATDNALDSLHQYIELVKQANDEADIDKKLALFDQANRAYSQYEKGMEQSNKLNKKLMKEMR